LTARPTRPPAAYRFTFDPAVPLPEAEASLQLAILAIEGLYGEARVRLDVAYHVDPTCGSITVDGSTEAGAALLGVFMSLLIKEFGSASVTVGRIGAEVAQ
jgi:hypothetical protein